MTAAPKRAGIRNHAIFRYGLTPFGFFETDDIERTQEYPAESATNRRRDEWMASFMKVDVDPVTNLPYLLTPSGTPTDPEGNGAP